MHTPRTHPISRTWCNHRGARGLKLRSQVMEGTRWARAGVLGCPRRVRQQETTEPLAAPPGPPKV